MQKRGLIIGIMKRRGQENHVELPSWQLLPTLLMEFAIGKPASRTIDERLGIIDSDRLSSPLELGKTAKKSLVATNVQESASCKVRQLQ